MVPMGLLFLVLGAGGAIYSGFLSRELAPARIFECALCTLFAILGLYVAMSARLYRVVLEADCIKVFGALRHRELNRINIAGRRLFVSQAGSARWILVPQLGFGSKLELSMFLQTDKDFSGWILSLPDLDRDKKNTEENEVEGAVRALKERGYGARDQNRLRRNVNWLNGGVFGLGVAMYLIPDPHHLLIWVAVATPWLAVLAVAKYRPFYRFGGPRKSRLVDLSIPLFMPGFFLVITALTSISTVYWRSPLALTLLGTLVLAGAALYVDPWLRRHLGAASVLTLLCCGYGYGAGVETNALLDHSVPASYAVPVLSKRISYGKSTTYYLGVPAWGPHPGSDEVMVPGWRYGTTRVGDTVCMLLRPGALRVAWYTLATCEH